METSQRPNAAGGPPWFPWGRSWEAELWHGGSSRCGLCRAGVGWWEGRAVPGSGALPRTWQAWAACGSEPLAAGPPAPGSFRNPQDPHWALHSTFLLPARGARPWPASSQLGLDLLDGTHVGRVRPPAREHRTGRKIMARPAEDPASARSARSSHLTELPASSHAHPWPARSGLPTSAKGALESPECRRTLRHRDP